MTNLVYSQNDTLKRLCVIGKASTHQQNNKKLSNFQALFEPFRLSHRSTVFDCYFVVLLLPRRHHHHHLVITTAIRVTAAIAQHSSLPPSFVAASPRITRHNCS
ncbi:hypothetical protein PILCRDRAFT_821020 [Piloderma croceum F 1598]|uniref:Uncharacterized protein n=1 Tax=Piloderma croceum (strain F 1598) TaxID=765440 RepID=A0A0C3BXR7_PILCF|nr:hypothetical protein PILCRDRAFT_821020 [Piloderma croceum F 1598]